MSNIQEVLHQGPATVREIAFRSDMSESRVREVIKALGDQVETRKDGTKAAEFWIENGQPLEPLPPACSCGSTKEKVQAGEEGTFLANADTCPDCGKGVHRISGEEIQVPVAKKRRPPVHPQHKIDAKVHEIMSSDFHIAYNRSTRCWQLWNDDRTVDALFTSQEFAEMSAQDLIAKAVKGKIQ